MDVDAMFDDQGARGNVTLRSISHQFTNAGGTHFKGTILRLRHNQGHFGFPKWRDCTSFEAIFWVYIPYTT